MSISDPAIVTKIKKWGNSQGLRLAKQVLEEACIAVGDDVDVAVRDGVIVIAPVKRMRSKHDLKKLVARIPKDYRAEEIEQGRPVGREVW